MWAYGWLLWILSRIGGCSRLIVKFREGVFGQFQVRGGDREETGKKEGWEFMGRLDLPCSPRFARQSASRPLDSALHVSSMIDYECSWMLGAVGFVTEAIASGAALRALRRLNGDTGAGSGVGITQGAVV